MKPTFEQSVKDMISAHDDLIISLRDQLAKEQAKLSAAEAKLKEANDRVKELEKYSDDYEYEENINGWAFFYSAENFLVQQLMEAVIKHGNEKGIVNTIDKINL